MVAKRYIVTLAFATLSEAEVEAFFTQLNVSYRVLGRLGRCLIIESEELSREEWEELGGLHKVAEVFAAVDGDKVEGLDLHEVTSSARDKMKWAVSTYSSSESSSIRFAERLKEHIKEVLKSVGVVKTKTLRGEMSRVDSSWEFEVSSQLLQKERIIEDGFEILAVKQGDWLIGRTIAVVDHLGFRQRDLERPVQDPLTTIPPKLARVLVNLTACRRGETLLDPFCGLGTILGEAVMRGLNVIGVDADPSRVDGARRNLRWLLEKYGAHAVVELYYGYAEELSKVMKGRLVDGVATEPILLPPLKHPPTDLEAERMLNRASKVYLQSLPSISRHLKPKGRLAIVLPCIRSRSRRILSFDVSDEASRAGLRRCRLNSVEKYPILIKDPNQRVMRGVYLFEKVNG